MDTVFPEGTAADRPFRIEKDQAFGPGVIDMKSGLLGGFVALDALREAGFGRFARITYVCNPDEEIGSPFSKPVIRELAEETDVCFVLEGGRENGNVVSARKGVADVVIDITTGGGPGITVEERSRAARTFKPQLRLLHLGRMNSGLFPLLPRISDVTNQWEPECLEMARDCI